MISLLLNMRGIHLSPLIFLVNMEILKERLQKIAVFLKNLKGITFVLVITSLLYFISFSSNIAIGFIKQNDFIFIDFQGKGNSIVILVITSIIIAPIFETFLGQFLPYYLLKKIKYMNERSYLILLASALFFGLLHFYSFLYIVYAFILGLVLSYGYMVRIKNDRNSFLLIAICHSLLNLGILIKNLI
jgi:uncharacterized protein